MFIAGIDYSMTNPAICIADTEKEFNFDNCLFFFLDKRKKFSKKFGKNVFGLAHIPGENNIDRYMKIADWAIKILEKFHVNNVALEGYSYGSKGSMVFNIAENTMALKVLMQQNSIKVITPSPGQIKKFFSGKGNAKKEEMVAEFITQTGKHLHTDFGTTQIFSKPIEDIVDSYAACKLLYEELKDEVRSNIKT